MQVYAAAVGPISADLAEVVSVLSAQAETTGTTIQLPPDLESGEAPRPNSRTFADFCS
jgi:hypothetical protein